MPYGQNPGQSNRIYGIDEKRENKKWREGERKKEKKRKRMWKRN